MVLRILSLDDHWVFRTGLKHLVKQLDAKVEFLEASNHQEALDILARVGKFDLILLDLILPDQDGLGGLVALHELVPDIPIVVISAVDTRREVLRAIDIGAMGYVSKASPGEKIVKALRQVLNGQLYLPKDLLQRDKSESQSATGVGIQSVGAPERVKLLTRRQQDVFALLGLGKSNAEIAKDLDMSEHTVRIHVSAILRTLQVNNRTQAALMAAAERHYVESQTTQL